MSLTGTSLQVPTRAESTATLWLELTPSCNLRCAFCYNPWRPGSKSAHPEKMAPQEYLAAVERLVRRRRFSYIALSGGEPLLYPRLPALVSALAASGQRTVLTTNGRLLSRATLNRLTGAGLNGLQVPLLAATPTVHDQLSGRASWAQAIRALALGLEAGISTSATFIATASNLDELPRVTELLGLMGVGHLVVNEMHSEGSARNRPELAVQPLLLGTVLNQARRLAREHELQLSFLPASGSNWPRPRDRSWHRLAVSPDGLLKLCNQSARTLGPLNEISDEDLDGLMCDLARGQVAGYRGRVDNCYCFDRLYGPDETAQTDMLHDAGVM